MLWVSSFVFTLFPGFQILTLGICILLAMTNIWDKFESVCQHKSSLMMFFCLEIINKEAVHIYFTKVNELQQPHHHP